MHYGGAEDQFYQACGFGCHFHWQNYQRKQIFNGYKCISFEQGWQDMCFYVANYQEDQARRSAEKQLTQKDKLIIFTCRFQSIQQFYLRLTNLMTIATSQVEKHFQMHNIYKRSKHYFDVQKMKEEQHLQEIYRRKPNYSIETLDTRVDQSFVNAANAVNKRLQHDISQFKRRHHDESETFTSSDTINRYQFDTEDETQEGMRTSRTRIRAPDLEKMQGRKSFIQNKVAYSNENQFNNYFMSSPRSRAQLNFSLNSPRSKSSLLDNPEKSSKQKQADLTKVHQRNTFSNSTYKCLFEYSKIGKYAEQSRKQRNELKLKPIQVERIQAAQKNARVNKSPGLSEFYLSIGKDTPLQMNYRYTKVNENFYDDLAGRKSQEDYSTRKRRDDMVEKRLTQVLRKKKVVDDRDELCDFKYFNRQSYRHAK